MAVEKSLTLLDNATLSQTDINAGFEFRIYNDGKYDHQYIISDTVNSHIRAHDIAVVETAPYKIPEKYAAYSKIMLDYQLSRGDKERFENHRVCHLKSDLYYNTTSVKIGRAEYFDMLATFYSFPYNYRGDKGTIEFRGSNYLYNDFGVVYPISSNTAVNPIGANTIAITKDNKIIITRQRWDAHTNKGKLMPSGSGVTSWHDYIDDESVDTLQGIVIHGAEYKLRLECEIPKHFHMDTQVLGMARVPKGMKPDFYCLTFVDATVDELVEAGAAGRGYEVIDAGDKPSRALKDYIKAQNAERPGAVSIQLFLEAWFLAESGR
ncbi:MAG: hypothetical protein Q4C36_10305 [Coriobacteriia bacterium]|nr:hypothetical protein [Coriobacteriia bacterium]